MTPVAEGDGRSGADTGAIMMTGEMEIAMEMTAMKDGKRDVKREVWTKSIFIFVIYNTEIFSHFSERLCVS